MRYFLFILFFQFALAGYSQAPVKWSVSYKEDQQTVVFKAEIEEGWHLYSQTTKQEDGPVATSFMFNENRSIKLKGKTLEPKPLKVYDPNFESQLKIFEKEVSFSQKVRAEGGTSFSGSVTYMVCNATMCLPPVEENFEITLTNKK